MSWLLVQILEDLYLSAVHADSDHTHRGVQLLQALSSQTGMQTQHRYSGENSAQAHLDHELESAVFLQQHLN